MHGSGACGQVLAATSGGGGRGLLRVRPVTRTLERRKGNPTISRAGAADFLFKAARAPEWIHRDAVLTD
ncbi:hypothetical protein ACIPIU_07310 [Streptomyces massasporeus]|uniref:hypothetical protein n=1 Tax=Streptomyces massasporeus TaxID=67324 RepID=UPI00381FEAFC